MDEGEMVAKGDSMTKEHTTEQNGQAGETTAEKKRRTRRCKDILAVTMVGPKDVTTGEQSEMAPLPNWPTGITRAPRAIAMAKKMQTDWAKVPENSGKTLQDIVLVRRLATIRGKMQVEMAFVVE
jgi:hypothetical protein